MSAIVEEILSKEPLRSIDLWVGQFTLAHEHGNPDETRLLNKYTYQMPFIAVTVYLIMVFCLPKLLIKLRGGGASSRGGPQRRQNPILSFILPLWNLILSVLSLIMFMGAILPYIRSLSLRGLTDTMCDEDRYFFQGQQTILFWSYMFALSKYFELVDTFLVILKNPERPVIFLHWYHHSTVLLFSWFAAYWHFSIGFIFMHMNALIHTFMYFYYFMTELGYRPSWGKILTIGQITQMFGGMFSVAYWMYLYYYQGRICGCDTPTVVTISCILMYGSYLLLFCKFFVDKYIKSSRATGKHSTTHKKKQ